MHRRHLYFSSLLSSIPGMGRKTDGDEVAQQRTEYGRRGIGGWGSDVGERKMDARVLHIFFLFPV